MSKGTINFIISLTLVLICLLGITLFVDFSKGKKTTEVQHVEQRNYNDSILVVEYQAALDSFRKVNPQAAQQFMQLIENQNQK